MHVRSWATGLALTTIVTGALVCGGATALADTPSPTPAPTADHADSTICTKRIPAALTRIDRLTTRINGDASTRGSTAWLRAKADQARSAGYTALADLLTERVADRPAKLDELAKLTSEVEHVRATDCAA